MPNLALKKIEKYHKDKGDEIIWNLPLARPITDKIYVSCVFKRNKKKCFDWQDDPKCLIGGSGYSLKIELPEEIEKIKPHINLGFTTRGCIRHCEFCIVPEKEGEIRIESDIYDLWDGKSKDIILLDNNILALPEHFFLICKQLKKENLRVDFNQGLDFRLLTNDIWTELKTLKHIHEIRFAFDNIAYKSSVLKTLELMKRNGLKDWQTRWYVYVGEKDTFESVFERLMLLKKYNQGVYLMRDSKVYNIPEYIALAQYTNTMGAFKMDFKDVFNKSKKLKTYRKFIPTKFLERNKCQEVVY